MVLIHFRAQQKRNLKKFAGKMGKEIPKKYKKGIAVFIDDAERFIYQGYDFAFDLFNLFSKKFEEETPKQPRIPIMFILIGEERYAPKIKYSLNNFSELNSSSSGSLPALSLSPQLPVSPARSLSDRPP